MRYSLYIFLLFTLISCKEISVRDVKMANAVANDLGAEKFEYSIVKHTDNVEKKQSSYIEFYLLNPSLLSNKNFNKKLISSYSAFKLYKCLKETTIEKINGINIIFEKQKFPNVNYNYYYSLKELKNMEIKTNIIDSFIYKCRKRDTLTLYKYLDETKFSFNKSDAYNTIYRKLEIVDYQIFYFFDDYKDDTSYYNIAAMYKIFNALESNSNFLMKKDGTNNKIFSVIP